MRIITPFVLSLLLTAVLSPELGAEDKKAEAATSEAAAPEASGPVASTATPKPYALVFDSARNGKQLGETRVTLKPLDDERWEFAFDTRATRGMAGFIGFKFREYSVFRWRDGRPETIDYGYAKKTGFRWKRRSLHIDAENQTITGRDDDGEFSIDYQPRLIDRNLNLVAISQDLRSGRADFSYLLANKRTISRRDFVLEGEETLATALGPLTTVRVRRQLTRPGRATTLWLAPTLDYQPVQVRQVEADGETIELKLR